MPPKRSDSTTLETSIFTKTGTEVPLFSKDLDYFIGRSIMLFGTSNSGKSTIIKDLLHLLSPHIPNILVCCPTNKLNQSYTGIVPEQFIHDDVKEDIISKILKRQTQVVKIYNSANDITQVLAIYNKITQAVTDGVVRTGRQALEAKLLAMTSIYDKMVSRCDDSKSDADAQLGALREAHRVNTVKAYQAAILSWKSQLDRVDALTDYEKIVARYININPEFMLIIDDAAFSAKTWCKYHAIQELFFNGRHYHITFMIAFQDDKLLDSSLRKNAFINIFTTEKVTNAYFERSANNFTRVEKNRLTDIADCVFSVVKHKSGGKYRKLVYLKDATPSSYHYTASLVEDFSFGSNALLKYCGMIKKKEGEVDISEFADFF
jgi:energy-coupling factor transporter ATP-binding protein EcfA2